MRSLPTHARSNVERSFHVPTTTIIFQQLGLAVLLGMLVGLQRQHAGEAMLGMRTFPLITLLGAIMALLGFQFGGWVVAAGLLAVVVVLMFPNLLKLREQSPDPGITTDIAALVMYGVGALLVVLPEQTGVAVAVGGGVVVLLQLKPELHQFARRLGDDDLKAIMQFALITCVILPVLPNRTYDPFGVVNPRETWLMVVLIVGMSLGGYIVYKFLGRDASILLGGLLGGAISSTATTVSYSRQARAGGEQAQSAAIVIMVASTVVFVRVLVEIAVVAPSMLATAAVPVTILMLLTLLPAVVMWFRVRGQPAAMPEQGNPTELKSAIFFAVMYAVVLLALAAAERYVGRQALYAVAGLSGLTDMDAITLSTARMFRAEDPASWLAREGWRLIIIAALANLVFKTALVGMLGGRRLLRNVAILYALPFLGGLALLGLWPGG